jgi:phage repressor protein C with HTH and peptisase S24 domain
MKAARLFGCSAQWILEGAKPEGANPADQGVLTHTVAHEVSHPKYNHAPKQIAWGALMSSSLGPEFQTELVDQAMAPELPAGSRVILLTGVNPEAGDFILVSDRHGNHYLREYRVLRPGVWQAHALNSAFLPLDHDRDGLKILAVYDGVRGRRSRR